MILQIFFQHCFCFFIFTNLNINICDANSCRYKEQIFIDTFQSEEGGRFFQEQNRNLIIIVEEDFPIEVPENYFWMTLNQLNQFLKFNNYLNIQARSLISLISFI